MQVKLAIGKIISGPELNRRIDDWIERNWEGTDLKFVTELEHQD